MTKPTKRFNLRLPPEDYARIMTAARESGLSVNRYIVAGALAYGGEKAQIERIEKTVSATVESQMQGHSAMVADALSRIVEQHAEQDAALREGVKAGLEKVLARLPKEARK